MVSDNRLACLHVGDLKQKCAADLVTESNKVALIRRQRSSVSSRDNPVNIGSFYRCKLARAQMDKRENNNQKSFTAY